MRCVISDAIEKVFISFFCYRYRGFVSRDRFWRQPRRRKPPRRCL